jgi:hypothetical protein
VNEYYEVGSQIFCGACVIEWKNDMSLVGDEVYRPDLVGDKLPNDEPIQCDGCLKQNEAYEELGSE